MTATDLFPSPDPGQGSGLGSETPADSGPLPGTTPADLSFPVDAPAVVDIAIPVYNEEGVLETSIRTLRSYLDQSFPFAASIVIVDNASVDSTWDIASRLTQEIPGVRAIHLDQKGRGRAIRTAWTASDAEVVAYMDVDLSTDLDGLLPLVAPLLSGHSQVAIGSRIAPGSRVVRGAKREFISRTYNLILRSTLRVRFSDAQCGFKAMRRDAVEPLLALIEDQHWFFDTELLIQAERNGLRIHEVSVDWIDDPDSRVHIASTAREDLRGVWRMSRRRRDEQGIETSPWSDRKSVTPEGHGEIARYARVGALSTVAYLLMFLLLRDPLGMFAANLLAAATTGIGNTLAHALYTFKADRRSQFLQVLTVGACSFFVAIGLTTATLAVTYIIGRTSAGAEAIAILLGMLTASCVRFVLLREWAFRAHFRSSNGSEHEQTVGQDQNGVGASEAA